MNADKKPYKLKLPVLLAKEGSEGLEDIAEDGSDVNLELRLGNLVKGLDSNETGDLIVEAILQ